MRSGEWSRSRFWLCHFLHSRHERPKIDWHADDALPPRLRESTRAWLARRWPAESTFGGQTMVEDALRRHGEDPAYIQSLRLLAKERQYHAGLFARLRERLGVAGAAPPLPLAPRLAGLPGARFELSLVLLSSCLEMALLRALRDASPSPLIRGVCEALLRDQSSHAAFAVERLTMELADLNFVRRNLRRARLRGMFAVALAASAGRHRALLRALGVPPHRFAAGRCREFSGVLERVVPYRRDALLAALLDQREHPYDDARPV